MPAGPPPTTQQRVLMISGELKIAIGKRASKLSNFQHHVYDLRAFLIPLLMFGLSF
jgi:hypothetical protein